MTPLMRWAEQYQIPPGALQALMYLLGVEAPADVVPTGGLSSEAGVQQQARLAAARAGIRLWRNNSGACKDEQGRMIRYGLANDSAQINAQLKSSDLVGITPIVCRCGWRYGVFTAYEIKAPGWKYRNSDARAKAQLAFIQLVISMGGVARFITDPAQII